MQQDDTQQMNKNFGETEGYPESGQKISIVRPPSKETNDSRSETAHTVQADSPILKISSFHLKIRTGRRILRRIAEVMRKYLVVFIIISISVCFHIALIHSIYWAQKRKIAKPVQMEMKTQIKQIEKVSPPPVFKLPEKDSGEKLRKAEKAKTRALSPRQLEAIGHKYLKMEQDGRFPAEFLTYDNPRRYVKEMYALGCITIVKIFGDNDLFRINLLTGEVLPIRQTKLKGFSSLKRVVKDREFSEVKARAASRLNASPGEIEIIMLVPLRMEARWLGYQLNCFKKANIRLSEVATVETHFKNSKLTVLGVNLKDGTRKKIDDTKGV